MHKSLEKHLDRVFVLTGYRSQKLKIALITPEPVMAEVVQYAWAYAVKYTAKSLEEPDHAAALKLLLERHPRWIAIPTDLIEVGVSLATADKDIPEG